LVCRGRRWWKAEVFGQLRGKRKKVGGFRVQGMKAKKSQKERLRLGKGAARDEENGATVWRRKKFQPGGGCGFFLVEMKSAAARVREKKGL
jgi:hypothetical protein